MAQVCVGRPLTVVRARPFLWRHYRLHAAAIYSTRSRLASTLGTCAWDAAVRCISHENLFWFFIFWFVGGASRLGGHAA